MAPQPTSEPQGRQNGSDLASRELMEAGVALSFGIPGIQNLAMYAGLERAGARAVLIANEESAAFAAAGVFEATRGQEIACANLIGGPGITHALAGIAIAHEQQVPMLVLTAGIKRGAAHASHRFQLHDVDNLGGTPRRTPETRAASARGRGSWSLPLHPAPPTEYQYAPETRAASARGRGGPACYPCTQHTPLLPDRIPTCDPTLYSPQRGDQSGDDAGDRGGYSARPTGCALPRRHPAVWPGRRRDPE